MKIETQNVEGYVYGAIQPSLVLRFTDIPPVSGILTRQLANLKNGLRFFHDDHRFSAEGFAVGANTSPALFVTIIDMLNNYCGDQRFTPIKVFEDNDALCFALPTLSPAMSVFNLNAVYSFLSNQNKTGSSEHTTAFAEKQKQQARLFLPGGTNAGNFIAAAAERKIPFKIFSRSYVIFNYGRNSSIFKSSIIDKESAIGVALAKSKVETNSLLRLSGLPVAEQMRVQKVGDALRFAEKIGYPVVLKPEAEEQGRGVFANISDEAELKECFGKASARYKNLVLEKFISGFSYRVHVHHGSVIDAWKMNPPSVRGDGKSSILELVNIENMNPNRNSINGSLKPVPLDAVTGLFLEKSGLTLNSIPGKGEQIILAATSNESRGGSPETFLSSLHPDNAELCIQAAQTLGLNISGVDLISEDASVSWRKNNTVVCEVNSQPQFGDLKSYPHLYNDIMDRLPSNPLTIKLAVSRTFKEHSSNLFNKAAANIVVECTPSYLFTHGSPVQYFDDICFADDVSVEDRLKLNTMILRVAPLRPQESDEAAC